jgi:hypothetical protein
MFISWKTDGSSGAVEFMEDRLSTGKSTEKVNSYENNGRINFKWEKVNDELIITEEWNLTRAEYDALNIIPADQPQEDGIKVPLVETSDHLSF